MRRFVAAGIALGIAFGAVIWFLLLASTSANTALFASHYWLLLVLNGLLAAVLLGLVGWQLRALWRDYRAKVFGARLKLRLMIMFGLIAVIPGVLVYGVSVQFVTRSIESWFDVKIEKALESGLNLGRSSLDYMMADLTSKARGVADELGSHAEAGRRYQLSRLREQTAVQSGAIFSLDGELLMSAQDSYDKLLPVIPTPQQLKQARSSRILTSVETPPDSEMILRVLVPLSGMGMLEEPRVLQMTQNVPLAVSESAEAVQAVYRDYQELQLARQGLTQIYALTLTLTVLMALFGAFALAFVMARRLAAPLYILAEGTQAVAQGDFSPRQAVYSQDELGVLTQSFNRMTRQLDDARRETERHRAEVEAARAYLESILANLSNGVLVLDQGNVLQTPNEGALNILKDDFSGLQGKPLNEWPRLQALAGYMLARFDASEEGEWQGQLELPQENGTTQTLLLRGSRLPEASGGGHVVVFDDISRLISAQRSVAWGEVARRLAHEIKNPLTPIQLSAERLQYKLEEKLAGTDSDMLRRSTQTIINQVQAMKRMVDEFRDYARLPLPELEVLDLNALIREVLGLYETSRVPVTSRLAVPLRAVSGDPTQLRQVIHNLLRNGEDALEGVSSPRLEIVTEAGSRHAYLKVRDNGPGFPPEILARAFEPYVTSKEKGTGLGLPIVKKIVDEHQGSIEINNLAEGGAEVLIKIPFAKEES